jgi:hypothetical protein
MEEALRDGVDEQDHSIATTQGRNALKRGRNLVLPLACVRSKGLRLDR